MKLPIYELAGFIGAAIIVVAYFAMQQRWLNALDWRFPAANLLGSLLILVSLWFEWNFPSVVIEIFWALISLMGLVRSLAERRRRNLIAARGRAEKSRVTWPILRPGLDLFLAVDVQLGVGVVEHGAPSLDIAAEQVGHHRVRMVLGRTERQTADRAHELLELAGTQASIVQWPELCGRAASSLTTISPDLVRNISTASTPTRSSCSAIWRAIASASAAISGAMRAGAIVVCRMWLTCRFSTAG